MKVRKVKIGVKDVETLLNEFGDAAWSIECLDGVRSWDLNSQTRSRSSPHSWHSSQGACEARDQGED